uniref:Cilia- and flagella-associated protein 206 n=1 Tax=Cyclopterus lumpus TaxID=8103 RepID=A0A8C3G4B0_CYCLU
MSGAHAESVIKNIILEIVQESRVRGHVVSDTLVAFMVKAVVLDPRNGFNVDRALTKQDLQKLEELCLDKLTEQCSPSLDTIKMQVYFDMTYTSRREFLEEVHRAVETRLSAVSRGITDSRAKTPEEKAALYRKIVTYVQLRSGMGSPTDHRAVQEAEDALLCVFPQTELGAFVVLLKREKEQQLRELTMIVTGIRLLSRAGEQADLLPALLNKVLPVAGSGVENELSAAQTLAWKYTALQERPTGRGDVPAAVLLKRALYNVRQHEAFLKMLLADARLSAKHVETLRTELSSQMKLLKETVQSQTTVPSTKAFVSASWSLGVIFAVVLIYLVISLVIVHSLIVVPTSLRTVLSASSLPLIVPLPGERIDPAEMETQEWLLPETTVGSDELPLQYDGVCGSTLVSRDGLLLPGNPHIGVLKHEEKLYVFSSKEAALKFASSPGDFIAAVAEKAKLFPELIQLLRLHQQFSEVSSLSHAECPQRTDVCPGESFLAKSVTKCESGTQTDVHPVETNVARSYDWNEWELRRKAIKLADLRTKLTRSVQTDLSHARRENASQTWLPKDAACQSKRDGGSNVPKPQVYVAGLRGQRDGRVVKTNLTRPAEEK